MPDTPHPPATGPIASSQPADLPIDDTLPPPPCESAEAWADGQKQGAKSSYPDEKTTTAPQPESLSYPTPSSYPSLQAPPGTRLLHIYRDSLFGRDLTIKDSDKTTIMYTVAANHGFLFSEKPHMRFYRGPVEAQRSMQPVGTATFRSFSRTIDLAFHGRSVSMKSTSLLGYSYEFESGMGSLFWKGSNLSNDMTLTTPGKEWLAKFDANSFALEKRGTLEIVHWNIPDVGLDEIVVSGMAMMEHMRREKG